MSDENDILDGPITDDGPPKTWLVESILATLFCCLPFGIAGIVYASKVQSRYNAGDIAGARQASKDAEQWTKISFILGLIGTGLYLVMTLLSSF